MDSKIVALLVLIGSAASASDGWTSNCPCVRIYHPLCASDGRTYNSPCELDCRNKYLRSQYREELYVVRAGRCDGDDY